jgi:hypothetical protein
VQLSDSATWSTLARGAPGDIRLLNDRVKRPVRTQVRLEEPEGTDGRKLRRQFRDRPCEQCGFTTEQRHLLSEAYPARGNRVRFNRSLVANDKRSPGTVGWAKSDR